MIHENEIDSFSFRSVQNSNDWSWGNAIISPIANISGSISSLYCLYYLTNLKELQFSWVQHIDFFNIQELENFSYIMR